MKKKRACIIRRLIFRYNSNLYKLKIRVSFEWKHCWYNLYKTEICNENWSKYCQKWQTNASDSASNVLRLHLLHVWRSSETQSLSCTILPIHNTCILIREEKGKTWNLKIVFWGGNYLVQSLKVLHYEFNHYNYERVHVLYIIYCLTNSNSDFRVHYQSY